MKKQVTLELTGVEVTGVSLLNLWGGGQGAVQMNTIRFKGKDADEVMNTISLKDMNDGQFGCESIQGAYINIFEVYGNSYKQYMGEMFIGNLSDKQMNSLVDLVF